MVQNSDERPLWPNIGAVIRKILTGIHYVGMLLVIVMMLLTTVHAIGRYFFGFPIPGLVEISCYLLVASIFLTAPFTALEKGHIGIGVIVERFSVRTGSAIDFVTNLLCLIIGILATWQSLVRAGYIWEEDQVSAVLSIPNGPFVFIVAVGWALFSLAVLWHTIQDFKKAVNL